MNAPFSAATLDAEADTGRVFAVIDDDEANWFATHGEAAVIFGLDPGEWTADLGELLAGLNVTFVLPEGLDPSINAAALVRAFDRFAAPHAASVAICDGFFSSPDQCETLARPIADWPRGFSAGHDGPRAEAQAEKSRFHAYREDELEALEPPAMLVEGLIPVGGLVGIYGAPGCGKSFFAKDVCRAIETGALWRGKLVRQGLVVYIAAEGGTGFRLRMRAYRQSHPDLDYGAFRLITACPNLGTKRGDLPDLIAAIRDAAADYGDRPALIMIDTCSQVIAGEDENGSGMTTLLFNCRALQSAFPGAAIGLVHHVGNEGTRPRGHTSFMAALDAAILVRADPEGPRKSATVTKMKDGESGARFDFELAQVQLGKAMDGTPMTSCIVRHTFDQPVPPASKVAARRPKSQAELDATFVLETAEKLDSAGTSPSCPALHKFTGTRVVPRDELRSQCYSRGFHAEDLSDTRKKAFNRALSRLYADKLIEEWEGWICLLP